MTENIAYGRQYVTERYSYAHQMMWTKIENGLGTPEAPMWWHKVNDQAVSFDAGQTYYLMNEPLTIDGDPVIYDVNKRPVPPKEN